MLSLATYGMMLSSMAVMQIISLLCVLVVVDTHGKTAVRCALGSKLNISQLVIIRFD